ncbi:FOG: Transposon-encoded proteins with TYA, reverse transcriptase, integrase domains in various combinations [Plasmopara halstedii]|uniref:FOG: Transposon-encoded proteins with TYA, reverse transcriptase, integrase domains in various combinations n=1 Tax=Plasmopara halstedii TaxID=4781 RepID=A0A0P1B3R1_PLAHL|nr:FOG: Transposon-encoded proteins with TYA, reverse transcriptase, integrase domains in various combinations [Plasmopara halstedii]CEG48170.1 FOG: Transposon-encoded proteins with TYA, reverse transcriptase, integrase domains in various combinations [Plasmopara halstedii]|eukprot:XP_024584539.1 FOG: Transposon-encoded proteins with TYA, reverse transcriptase, integrase domains in various combinations [Plasmopara halstedii]
MPVSWVAKKQGGVSLSTMEADFVAASETARELLGIQEMLKEVGLAPTQPMTMHVDNQATIRQIEGETSSLEARHIDVRLKFVKDFARRGVVEMRYVRSELMLADLLTKALDQHKLAELRALVGLR